MDYGEKLIIRKASEDDWEDAMALAWKTFNRFVADDYSLQGVSNFQDFVTDNGLYKMFLINEYHMWVAEYEGEIIGMISLRGGNHISLLFVDGRFHRKGVGTLLMTELWKFIAERGGDECTVNASPFGVSFYHRLGFEDTAEEYVQGGMRITPMTVSLKGRV